MDNQMEGLKYDTSDVIHKKFKPTKKSSEKQRKFKPVIDQLSTLQKHKHKRNKRLGSC